ncbi:hypothetical protein [Sphingorhabdus pulchriflava]|uniref:hypothetical protein n=1 Tax=Sphingorhabdus pulchriflava TaxID=2292257 RepID=UPI0011C028F8|nr:hypothetical protein [Sphingorhabdus pulchriflava]
MSADKDKYHHVREFVSKQREQFYFDARKLQPAENEYVAWIDLMGAGHTMSVSVSKTANYMARLHMAVDMAAAAAPSAVKLNPINDGVFVTSSSKAAIMSVVRQVMYSLGGYFISTGAPHDRCLLRASIAFGPVYHGDAIAACLSKTKKAKHEMTLSRVEFGAPIIQAYHAESDAPPYGVSIHESARAFAPPGEQPFRTTHWLWWPTMDEIPVPPSVVSLPDLARCLAFELKSYFDWMRTTAIFHGVKPEKINEWSARVEQYFSVG